VSEQPDIDRSEGATGQPQPRAESPTEAVSLDPQRLIRIASVTREVLDEARRIRGDTGAVEHLRRFHDRVTGELKDALPPELYKELDQLTPELGDGSLEELSLANAEILGWLEGLFQGTQIAMQLQAMRAFSEQQRRALPQGPGAEQDGAPHRERGPGYL
jgi:proteasome activator-like protein